MHWMPPSPPPGGHRPGRRQVLAPPRPAHVRLAQSELEPWASTAPTGPPSPVAHADKPSSCRWAIRLHSVAPCCCSHAHAPVHGRRHHLYASLLAELILDAAESACRGGRASGRASGGGGSKGGGGKGGGGKGGGGGGGRLPEATAASMPPSLASASELAVYEACRRRSPATSHRPRPDLTMVSRTDLATISPARAARRRRPRSTSPRSPARARCAPRPPTGAATPTCRGGRAGSRAAAAAARGRAS